MIKFTIEDKEYYLPDYLTLENYVKIYKVKDLFTDEYFAAKLVSIVSGAPQKDLLDAEYPEISFLANQILKTIPTEKPEFVDRFELLGTHYGFFPTWKELTFAEFIDMDTISTKKPEELLDLLHILAAIMYRPIVEEKSKHNFTIEEYDVDKMKKRAELFKKHLNVNYVLGAQFFFIEFAKKSLDFSRPFLTKRATWIGRIVQIWMIWRMIFKMTSKKHLGGLSWLIASHKMISQSMITSTNVK